VIHHHYPSSGRRLLAVGAALAVATVATLVTANAGASTTPPPPGWSLIWQDDFNGPAGSQPSTVDWRITPGHEYPGGPANFGTGEIELNTSSADNINLDGAGNLRITPIRGANPWVWTSGRLETNRSDFKPAPGTVLRIESRIKMPDVNNANGLGYWPSFFAIGAPFRGVLWNLPSVGMFDLAENVNGVDQVWGGLHCDTRPGGACNEPTGLRNSRACSAGTPAVACQADFHTYRFEWDRSSCPNQLRWYLDGTLFHSVSRGQIPPGIWDQFTSHQGYFLLLKVAIGGDTPYIQAGGKGVNEATVSGKPMVVDYVSVQQSASTGSTACGPKLLSRGRPTKTSSSLAGYRSSAAVDGNLVTRWNSKPTNPQWIQVDLGSVQPLGTVALTWGWDFAREYRIETSTNGRTWTKAFATTTGDGNSDLINLFSARARYVRMYGVRSSNGFGYALREFEVYRDH
jgi:beta-glucanase (GH16 family)